MAIGEPVQVRVGGDCSRLLGVYIAETAPDLPAGLWVVVDECHGLAGVE